ncbi:MULTISPECIES: hypothetical protein [Ideonella]|uniref:Uncharacterized protein n=1 Tax=Ideonella oryzae TaxID=2937441 RepID=A0ABT1BU17_9BURK|nr:MULTISPECIES: hypothetical protein [Ideonella]MCO5979031.1 hypothetical protein [Ideonella oryzae]
MNTVPTPTFLQRASALGGAALITLSVLSGLGGIADRQVDGAVLALRAQACTAVAAGAPALPRLPA